MAGGGRWAVEAVFSSIIIIAIIKIIKSIIIIAIIKINKSIKSIIIIVIRSDVDNLRGSLNYNADGVLKGDRLQHLPLPPLSHSALLRRTSGKVK